MTTLTWCRCNRWLLWHGVGVIVDYLDMVSEKSLTTLTWQKLLWRYISESGKFNVLRNEYLRNSDKPQSSSGRGKNSQVGSGENLGNTMPNNNKPKTILFLPYICTLLDQTKPQHINLINSSKNSIRSVYHLFQCNLSGKYSQKIHISWTDLLFFY